MQQASPYLKSLTLDGEKFSYYALDSLANTHDIKRLPFAAKILLENLLRHSQESFVQDEDIQKLANWDINDSDSTEIAF
ncbi:MAG: hypothetical protein V7733_21375, partial [Paraglaciecola polaris]